MDRRRKITTLSGALVVLLAATACSAFGDHSAAQPAIPGAQVVQPPPSVAPSVSGQIGEVGNPPALEDSLQRTMRLHAKQLAQGMSPATTLFRGTLATGEEQNFQATLQPGKCFKIIGVGGETVQDLDLILYDPSGTLLQQDVQSDSFPVLGLTDAICPATAGSYRVQVKMYRGQGEFGVQVFSN